VVRFVDPKGRERWLRVGSHSIQGPDGAAAFLVMVDDRTAVQELEDQLAKQSQLSQLGEMAASLAHEITQPLAVIRYVAEGSLDGDPAPLRRCMRTILDQTARLQAIIDHVRGFGRKHSLPPRPFDPVAVARSAIKLMRHRFNAAGVVLDGRLPRQGTLVIGHASRFEQVMVNLLSNGLDAALERHPEGGGRVGIAYAVEPGRGAVLTVEDNGAGIPRDLRDRIFEPFFTSKPADKGTGLGLSICLDIVAAMGGRIEAVPVAEGGCLTVCLPLPPNAKGGAVAAEAGPRLEGRHVLVVDDEPAALAAIASLLARHGCRVTTARSGRQALALFVADPADAVITDLSMPDGDGNALILGLRELAPSLGILVVTASRPGAEDVCTRYANAVLAKPASLQDILGQVGALFERVS
jgi:nitrogen-specific signal transduction histidine kinase/CheY-like chemotaxis protein